MIHTLKENEIFVFGSNLAGFHGAGAAKQARVEFGAKYGVGEGLTGRTYALPTLDENLFQREYSDLEVSIQKFIDFAEQHPELTFMLTKIGCGLAGYNEEYIKEFFIDCPENIVKPKGW